VAGWNTGDPALISAGMASLHLNAYPQCFEYASAWILRCIKALTIYLLINIFMFLLLHKTASPGLWRNRLEALTADEKVWIQSPLGPKQSEVIFSVHLNRQDCSGGSEL
jgi:hypothetical protein